MVFGEFADNNNITTLIKEKYFFNIDNYFYSLSEVKKQLGIKTDQELKIMEDVLNRKLGNIDFNNTLYDNFESLSRVLKPDDLTKDREEDIITANNVNLENLRYDYIFIYYFL